MAILVTLILFIGAGIGGWIVGTALALLLSQAILLISSLLAAGETLSGFAYGAVFIGGILGVIGAVMWVAIALARRASSDQQEPRIAAGGKTA
jgi:hypothetical protein